MDGVLQLKKKQNPSLIEFFFLPLACISEENSSKSNVVVVIASKHRRQPEQAEHSRKMQPVTKLSDLPAPLHSQFFLL